MIFKEISDRSKWIHLKDIQVPEHNGLEYHCYMVFEQKLLSLYAVCSTYGKRVYDAKLQDFALNVFSLVVEKTIHGHTVAVKEFLTGTTKYTVDSAVTILSKNYLDFVDDFSRIEVVLEENDIPYVKDLDQVAKSYVRGRIRIIRPELVRHFSNKNFKIDLTAGDTLLSQMLSAATTMQTRFLAKKSTKEMTITDEDAEKFMKAKPTYDQDKFISR